MAYSTSFSKNVDVTTSKSLRTIEEKVSRRLKIDTYQRLYKRLDEPFSRLYNDIFFYKVKSSTGDTCTQLYFNRPGVMQLYQMKMKSQAHETFTVFVREDGIPHTFHSDNTRELVTGGCKKKVNKYEVHTSEIKP